MVTHIVDEDIERGYEVRIVEVVRVHESEERLGHGRNEDEGSFVVLL